MKTLASSSPRVLFVGRATLDVLYFLDQFPVEDTKLFARAVRPAPGGPATNAAITHALMGGKALLMTALGRGASGDSVLSALDPLGIELLDLAAGTCYEAPMTTVLVNAARATRTIVNPPQSDLELNKVATWDATWGELPAVVLTDGFHLAETLPLLASCSQAGSRVCLDGGSWKPGTDKLAGVLTAAICSERFVVPGRPADAGATMDWFREKGVPSVAITRGALPILGSDRGRRFEIEVERIDAADTLGAGDVLHGAFCNAFAAGAKFEEALRSAAVLATRSCRGIGIRSWIDSGNAGA